MIRVGDILIRHATSWDTVLNACRITQNKPPTFKEPSEVFIKRQIKLRHKTLELKRYEIIAQMPHFVYMHLRAHRQPLAFVGSRREDLQDKPRDPNEIITAYLNLSAEDLLRLAEQRLCYTAHLKTQETVAHLRDALYEIEPHLAAAMHPRCVVEGFCREGDCKYLHSAHFIARRAHYLGGN